jgi:hypothetical protein
MHERKSSQVQDHWLESLISPLFCVMHITLSLSLRTGYNIFIRTFEFKNQVGDQTRVPPICYLESRGAFTHPNSAPNYYILVVLLVHVVPPPIDQM